MFADPKTSEVDIIQAVGRVLRTSPGKTIGTVLVPVVVPTGVDDDSAMSVAAYAHVWKVLRALRGMDPQLADDLDAITRGNSRHGTTSRGRVRFRLPSLADVTVLTARTADLTGNTWDERYDDLERFVDEHGHATPAKSTPLGVWCDLQRRSRRNGMLTEQREAALESVPGWVWDLGEHRWRQQLSQVLALAEHAGGLRLRDDDTMNIAMQVKLAKEPRTVGEWCAAQRIAARTETLDATRRHLLEQVPGWRWDVVTVADAAAVDLLAEYVAWKKDANVPEGWSEDGIRLGDWLRATRRARASTTWTVPFMTRSPRSPPDAVPPAPCSGTGASACGSWGWKRCGSSCAGKGTRSCRTRTSSLSPTPTFSSTPGADGNAMNAGMGG